MIRPLSKYKLLSMRHVSETNCKSFSHCCKSNARQNTRLVDRMTEVKCFQHSKNRTKKNINYLRIQRFKRLIHWFHFDPVRDLSHLLTAPSKRFCSNFFVNESLLYFEDGKNHVAFIIGKFDFEPQKSEQYLATAWRGFEAHKVCHIN